MFNRAMTRTTFRGAIRILSLTRHTHPTPDVSSTLGVPRGSPARDIRVLALLPYPVGRVGGQRYRLEQWASILEADGITITYSSFLGPSDLDVLYEPGHIFRKSRAVVGGYLHRLTQ